MSGDDETLRLWISAGYDGECSECEAGIVQGDRIVFDTESRQVYCGECGEEIAGEDPKGKR
jgi:ribosomal protein S27E